MDTKWIRKTYLNGNFFIILMLIMHISTIRNNIVYISYVFYLSYVCIFLLLILFTSNYVISVDMFFFIFFIFLNINIENINYCNMLSYIKIEI